MSTLSEKRRKIKQDTEKAAKQNKIMPWGSTAEDAQPYSRNTRQGQNYWKQHMVDRSAAIKDSRSEERKKKDEELRKRQEQFRRTYEQAVRQKNKK